MKMVTPQQAERPVLGPAYSRETARLRQLTPAQTRVRDRILAADAPDDYEPVPCICGATGDEIVLAQVERHGLPYRKVACRVCGLLRVTPRWTAERYARFYQHEYRDLYNPVMGSKEQFARELGASSQVRALAAWIGRAMAGYGLARSQPRIVEIGAGGGWNLGALPATWERIGYDVDREYLAIGERVFGCVMRYGFVADAISDVAGADLVLLSHVVEHFLDPVSELRTLAAAMSSAAILLLEVPGIFRIHRTNLDVMSYMQNAHTFTFCAATLRYVCELAGFQVLAVDETVRAVCRPRAAAGSGAVATPPSGLTERIVAYLRRCEAGYRPIPALRGRFPVIGRFLTAGWRRTYFPLAYWMTRYTHRVSVSGHSQGDSQ